MVVSSDPAHSLSDSFETELGPDPTAVAEWLWGQEVQAEREMEANWGAVQRWLGSLLADRGVMDIAAEELTVPPGMDELFSLLQIKRHHGSGEFDVVILVQSVQREALLTTRTLIDHALEGLAEAETDAEAEREARVQDIPIE